MISSLPCRNFSPRYPRAYRSSRSLGGETIPRRYELTRRRANRLRQGPVLIRLAVLFAVMSPEKHERRPSWIALNFDNAKGPWQGGGLHYMGMSETDLNNINPSLRANTRKITRLNQLLRKMG